MVEAQSPVRASDYAIVSFLKSSRRPVTARAVAAATGLSVRTVNERLNRMTGTGHSRVTGVTREDGGLVDTWAFGSGDLPEPPVRVKQTSLTTPVMLHGHTGIKVGDVTVVVAGTDEFGRVMLAVRRPVGERIEYVDGTPLLGE